MANDIGLFEAMYTCRAMRRIKPDPVPPDVLKELIAAANQAPTASNQQHARWIVVRDVAVKKALADINRAAIVRNYGTAATAPPDPRAERGRSAFLWQAEHMEEIPALVVACLEFASPPVDTFVSGAGAGGSIWPAVQNLLLAARGLGLGAVPTTLPLADRTAAKTALELPAHVEPFCVIPVGYPMGRFGPVSRRPLDEVMRWDRWA